MSRRDPELPRVADLLVSLLLLGYPRTVRTRFGQEMRQFIIDAREERRRTGRGVGPTYWFATFWGLVSSAFGARRDSVRRARSRSELAGTPRRRPGLGTLSWLRRVPHSLRYACRGLRHAPAYTITALLTLGLGVGASTWIFAVVQPVLISPLPYPDPDELVVLFEHGPGPEGTREWASAATFHDWVERCHAVELLSSYRLNTFTWTGSDRPRILRGWAVNADYFQLLGVDMVLGRAFTRDEDRPGAPHAVVISHALWTQAFGSDAGVLGRTMTLDGAPYTIVGVAGPSITFPSRGDYWIPAALDFTEDRDFRYLGVLGRLRGGATLEDAVAEMDGIAADVAAENPATNEGWDVEVRNLKTWLVAPVRPTLLGLSVAVAFLFLIAAGNVTNLSLARTVGRRTEAAVRVALGAGRGALTQLFLAESLVLALLGAGAGLLLARIGVDVLASLDPGSIRRSPQVAIGPASVLFATLVALAAGTTVGLLSILVTGRRTLGSVFSAGGRAGTPPGRAHRVGDGVLTVQVALALALLVGATLLTRSLVFLTRVDVGVDTRNVVTFGFELPSAGYAKADARRRFQRELLGKVEEIPGVIAAGLVTPIPLDMGSVPTSWTLAAGAAPPGTRTIMAHMRNASPGYRAAMGLRLEAGRFFDDTDREDSTQVVVVNRAFVRRYLAGEDPLGVRITPGDADVPESEWLTIIGVVDDVRFRSLRFEGEPELYLPAAQFPPSWGSLVVRSSRSPRDLTPALAAALRQVDPDLPLGEARTGDDIVSGQLRTSRLAMLLAVLFAIAATVLAVVGIVGVLSIRVAFRLPEMGIRIALGSSPEEVSRLVLVRGMRPVLVGLGLGLAIALLETRLLASQMYGISALDPVSFLLPVLVLLTAGFLACRVPSGIAAQADPVRLLRSE